MLHVLWDAGGSGGRLRCRVCRRRSRTGLPGTCASPKGRDLRARDLRIRTGLPGTTYVKFWERVADRGAVVRVRQTLDKLGKLRLEVDQCSEMSANSADMWANVGPDLTIPGQFRTMCMLSIARPKCVPLDTIGPELVASVARLLRLNFEVGQQGALEFRRACRCS